MAVISFKQMVKPLIKSIYKFKELSGKHILFDKVFVLVARAGETTYIDRFLEQRPNCAMVFEINDENNIDMLTHFFPDNPHHEDEVIGVCNTYEGGRAAFLSQKQGQADYTICFLNKSRYVELCITDSETIISPQNCNIDELNRQRMELSNTYTEIKTNEDAVSAIWSIGKESNEGYDY